MAHFQYHDIAPSQFIHSGMKVKAKLYDIQYYLFPERIGTIEQIPREIKEAYLVDGEKYRVHDPFIQKSAREAVGDEKNAYWIARKIFDYVIERIRYEMVGGWNIAPTVLKRGTGSCSEYSFVYIALCRAAGLPARYVGSYAVRGDDASLDDVFHRWVEVYLPNYGWVPVDPSRGDKDSPRDQAAAFGHAYARLLITTVSGGGSEYLGWTYNASEKWTCESPCKVHVETVAEWEPISKQ
ncbi:MAG: transglutaminase-like domain-containing protein [candidate division WOR-3 bacterium]